MYKFYKECRNLLNDVPPALVTAARTADVTPPPALVTAVRTADVAHHPARTGEVDSMLQYNLMTTKYFFIRGH